MEEKLAEYRVQKRAATQQKETDKGVEEVLQRDGGQKQDRQIRDIFRPLLSSSIISRFHHSMEQEERRETIYDPLLPSTPEEDHENSSYVRTCLSAKTYCFY